MKPAELGRYEKGVGVASLEGEVRGRPFKIELNLDRPSERFICECHRDFGGYEGPTLLKMLTHVTDESVFFDVGAHCGYFATLMSAAIGPNGLVLAFEPDADNFASLSKNAAGILLNLAVGRTTGTAPFYKNLDNDGGNALWNPAVHPHNIETRQQNPPPQMVPMVCLNDYRALYPTIIKIDTEGAEVEVLSGAEEILAQPQLKLVIAECNLLGLHMLGSSEAELRAIMARHGFSAEDDNGAGVDNIFFTRP